MWIKNTINIQKTWKGYEISNLNDKRNKYAFFPYEKYNIFSQRKEEYLYNKLKNYVNNEQLKN